MRSKEMHPLCCITLESPGVGSRSPADTIIGGSDGNAGLGAAGILSKWTNYRKRWRPRWFLLRNGLLSYSKIRRLEHLELLLPAEDLRVIGNLSGARLARLDGFGSRRRCNKTDENGGAVHLQISSFRESRSDGNRFYIFTATKKLHLRADSKRDRVAWIEALSSTRSLYLQRSVNASSSLAVPNDIRRISTEKLKNRLRREGGISEALVEDCEQIMLLEFSQAEGKLKVLREERSTLLDTVRLLEEANIEAEGSSTHESDRHLVQEKYSVTDEGEVGFFDTEEHFSEPTDSCAPIIGAPDQYGHGSHGSRYPLIERRTKLPDPVEKENGISLWSMIKDNVGKDLTRVCLPVYSNEPISSLQKCFEDLEYSYLLDQAYEYGKAGNSLLRALKVAAFAISGYASSEARHCKPFNALLGETYEADYPDKGIRFFSEKVCHHPTLIACHCEGKGWKLWGDSNLHIKFWGTSIQLDPIGVLNLEFDDGEVFQWSKVTTTIYNLIGMVYCDHHGVMQIYGNRRYSCKLKFKEQSFIDRNPHQVDGFVEDDSGKKAATLFGKWDDCIYFINGDWIGKSQALSSAASLLWQRNKMHSSLTRYNLTPFAITFNELTPLLKGKLPPTDSRLRPDQRHLENGEYEKAYAEKRRLEGRQRMLMKLQETGWRPRWFAREGESGAFRYVGGYWEAREQGKWDGCANIFGDFDGDAIP